MPVYKSDNGTWYVLTRYLDWKGERKQKCKRGFETRKEAVEWERTFQQQNAADMDMTFEAFFELYANDIKPRLKENTWLTKEHIVETKIMFFRLVKQMAEREGVTEKLKADNQMEWVGRMNNIRSRATEIVNAELIFA